MSNAMRPAPPWELAGRSPLTALPELVIPPRFCGPAGRGNGGYVCGRIAAYADGPLAVTLRRPPPGDGLRVFPGPVPGRTLWAAPWTPDSSVTGQDGRARPEVAWAALDCPSGIAAAEHARLGRETAIVLGQMTASLTTLPASGDQCRVVAWPEGGAGRKLTAGSALIGPGDEVLAVARAVWITVPRPVPGSAGGGS